MDDAKILKEFGIFFTQDVKKELPPGWKRYSYKWQYLPNKKEGVVTIACKHESDFNDLMNFWTGQGGKYWKYTKVESCETSASNN